MMKGKLFTAVFTMLFLAAIAPYTVAAAPLEIPASTQSSLDKTLADLDLVQADQIRSLYQEFLSAENQKPVSEAKVKSQHTANTDALNAVTKEIKLIDSAALDQLETDLNQAKAQYEPLFSLYTSLNKQIEAARLIKDKDLSSMLRFQADTLKVPIQLARAEIKTKDQAWKTAKDKASKKIKKIRTTLTSIDPLNVQIKAKQSAIRTLENSLSPLWTAFKQAVKKEDSISAKGTLGSLVNLSQQIQEENQSILNLETKISGILSAAKEQMP